MKFAKLFELEGDEQVLVYIEAANSTESEDVEVAIRTDFEDCQSKTTIGFECEKDAINALEKIDMEYAVAFRKEMAKMFEG